MSGEKDLSKLVEGMTPVLNEGEYVFVTSKDPDAVPRKDTICEFHEEEGTTLILERDVADSHNLDYQYIASWITLEIHSSLEAVGLTAAFSTVLAENNISCNVVAGYFHDHIFVDKKDGERAIRLLNEMG